MIKNYNRALLQINEGKGKTTITVIPNCPFLQEQKEKCYHDHHGIMVEDLIIAEENGVLSLMYKVGRWAYNYHSYNYFGVSYILYERYSNIRLADVVEKDTDEYMIEPYRSRIFRADKPAVFGKLAKVGYVELKEPKVQDYKHVLTNFHLKIDEKYELAK